jgi:hypothetical protein
MGTHQLFREYSIMKVIGYREAGNPRVVLPTDIEITPTEVICHGTNPEAMATGRLVCANATFTGETKIQKGFGMGAVSYDPATTSFTMDPNKFYHSFAPTVGATTLIMDDGTNLGQLVAIKNFTALHSVIITPTTHVGNFTVIYLNLNEQAYMIWTSYGWSFIATTGGIIR